jgi:hypothetical protein
MGWAIPLWTCMVAIAGWREWPLPVVWILGAAIGAALAHENLSRADEEQ